MQRAMSVDELLARELQARWDSEEAGGALPLGFAEPDEARQQAHQRHHSHHQPRYEVRYRYRSRRGASSRQISELPEFPVGEGSKYLSDDCLVCRERFVAGDVIRLLPCIHVYHRDCIDPWLVTNRTCPTCTRRIDAHHEHS